MGGRDVDSAAGGDADSVTVFPDGAEGAFGGYRAADVLTESDEQAVNSNPVLLGQLLSERLLRILGRFRLDVAKTIEDPVDVRVDADAGFVVTERYDEVGRLSTDPLKPEKLVYIVRNASVVFFQEPAAYLAYVFRLRIVETDWIDRVDYFLLTELEHPGGTVRKFEEFPRSGGRGFVLCAQAEDGRYQHPERIARGFSLQSNNRDVPPGGLFFENIDYAVNMLRFHRTEADEDNIIGLQG